MINVEIRSLGALKQDRLALINALWRKAVVSQHIVSKTFDSPKILEIFRS